MDELAVEKSLFEIPEFDFQNHLKIPENNRILFSGKFGKGKTTFLKYFFSNEDNAKNSEKYFAIHLSPVNYSVSTNEDIVRYIKYDIILELLRNGINFESFDIEFKDSLSYYIYRNPEKVIGRLISFIPYVGKELDDLYEKGKKLIAEVKAYKKDINEKSESQVLIKYLEEIEEKSGSLYEDDFITKIIEKKILSIQKEKQVILIIDDLDRLDPDHIFRILNVFAAHFDLRASKNNKFGFDKIILVCDLENIRNIYINRFGSNVDFLGYVDKFYSKEPFYFNNFNQLQSIANKLLKQIQVLNYNRGDIDFLTYMYGRNSINLKGIIHLLLFYDIISLRTIISFSNNHSIDFNKSFVIYNSSVDNDATAILAEVEILIAILGGYNATLITLEKISVYKMPKDMQTFDNAVGMILYFFAEIIGVTENKSEYRQIQLENEIVRFKIHPNTKCASEPSVIYSKTEAAAKFPRNERDFYNLLINLIKSLRTQGVV